MSNMGQNKKKRQFRKHFKQPYKPHHPGPTQRTVEPVAIDYQALPADMSAEQVEQLVAALPAPKKRTKPKPLQLSSLLALSLNEMHAVAEEEKVPDFTGRNRRDAVWEITRHRLLNQLPVIVEGTLEPGLNGHAFLRHPANDYMPATDDVFVPHSIIKRFGLARGMTVNGRLRPPAENEKYLCLWEVEAIDHHEPEKAPGRTPFKELVPLYPDQRIILEGTEENPLEMRIVDLITPIGRGQRGLIVAPPRTGKTILLQMLAKSIVEERAGRAPDHPAGRRASGGGHRLRAHDARGHREVVSSTFDEPAARHIQVADMVIKKARSLVEAGEDVIILLDSITRLARACNIEAPSNGKLLSGGMEATALQFPKKFFGAARNIEDGGSLTILGTALIETGSKMDEVIFEEFKGTGNMELVLDRRLSDRRIFPAIDINRSGTRKEELLFTPEEIKRVWMLRKVLNEMDPVEAMEMLIQKMKKTRVNGEFLMTIGG